MDPKRWDERCVTARGVVASDDYRLFQIAVAATDHLTPVTLELGGKDPAIVLPGTDLNKWASVWMRGILYVFSCYFPYRKFTNYISQNMGQNCIGIERLLVHSSQYDDLHDILVERVRRLRPGSVLAQSPEGYVSTIDCGSMINGDRFRGLEKVIRDASEGGALVEGGGAQYHHAYLENGYYFSPTVVGAVEAEMDIANQERARALFKGHF